MKLSVHVNDVFMAWSHQKHCDWFEKSLETHYSCSTSMIQYPILVWWPIVPLMAMLQWSSQGTCLPFFWNMDITIWRIPHQRLLQSRCLEPSTNPLRLVTRRSTFSSENLDQDDDNLSSESDFLNEINQRHIIITSEPQQAYNSSAVLN